jgi:tRNA nucleotidyltransferase (CCA-adding enzyme)
VEIYLVGGAVRDSLLGLGVSDSDYVVVGATPEQMLEQGFRPVGKDFPVFLHPRTQEEYALARTERKTAAGYAGFNFHTAPDITLEQDLMRRDLTINAMARSGDGVLHDPFGGQRDIGLRVLRHVSHAFVEDPVRILRLARFAARLVSFSVAPETMQLMRQMVAAGEVDALVPERIWQEISRGLMEAQPSRMLDILHECGALARIFPELERLWSLPWQGSYRADDALAVHALRVLDATAAANQPLPVRFSVLMLSVVKSFAGDNSVSSPDTDEVLQVIHNLCQRLRVPVDVRELAHMSVREKDCIARAIQLSPEQLVELMSRCDVWRKPQRFTDMLAGMAYDYRLGKDEADARFIPEEFLLAAVKAGRAVNSGAIAATLRHAPLQIPTAVLQARCDIVRKVVQTWPGYQGAS